VFEVSASVRIGVRRGWSWNKSAGGQVARQERAAGVDRLLHLLLGHVDVQREVELQGDDAGAIGTGRGHLLQSGHLPECRSSGAVTLLAITSGLAPG